MTMYADRILVTHASTGGSTKSVAEFIAARLRLQGVTADVRGLDERPDLDGYDAVVLGSAVRSGALLPAAEEFLRHNADALRVMPVWLFSLGLTPALRGPIGHFMRDTVPSRIAALCELVGPRDYRAFAGVVPRGDTRLVARFVLWLCGGRFGDLRDWPAIDAWTAGVAAYLHGSVPA